MEHGDQGCRDARVRVGVVDPRASLYQDRSEDVGLELEVESFQLTGDRRASWMTCSCH